MKDETIHESVNRRRDNIIRNARVGEPAPESAEAIERMEAHLRQQGKRCTVERRFVLEMLYAYDQPVDVGTLHRQVCEQQGNVSLTTVYTTLQLLEELHLARRIDLVSHGMTFFERALGLEPRGYVVCNECGALKPIRRPGLLESCSPMLPKGFQPDGYTFLIHGLCAKCQKPKRTRKKQEPKTK